MFHPDRVARSLVGEHVVDVSGHILKRGSICHILVTDPVNGLADRINRSKWVDLPGLNGFGQTVPGYGPPPGYGSPITGYSPDTSVHGPQPGYGPVGPGYDSQLPGPGPSTVGPVVASPDFGVV